jgi:hypothetical protein
MPLFAAGNSSCRQRQLALLLQVVVVAAGSSWNFCPSFQAILGGTCNDPHSPCVAGSGNFNAGQLGSLEACQAACIASASNFSCRAVEWHGPSTGAWAHTCILQQIAAFKPQPSDSGHNAACLPGKNDMPLCTPGCKPPAPPTFRFAQASVSQFMTATRCAIQQPCLILNCGFRLKSCLGLWRPHGSTASTVIRKHLGLGACRQ